MFTTEQARADGLTISALKWAEAHGRIVRIGRGVYAEGPGAATGLERAVAPVIRTGGVASGHLAGVLLGLDGVGLRPTPPPRKRPENLIVVEGIACTDGLRTLVDLAATLDDDRWEQALESALRKRLVTIAVIEGELPTLGATRTSGTARMRRVLARRPAGAPPTESLLETLAVQLARTVPGLHPPLRQLCIEDDLGHFVARVDLAWPSLHLFLELDGQHHHDQPVYDAFRETAVVAATGWRCGRFTWTDITRVPATTARRLGRLAAWGRHRVEMAS